MFGNNTNQFNGLYQQTPMHEQQQIHYQQMPMQQIPYQQMQQAQFQQMPMQMQQNPVNPMREQAANNFRPLVPVTFHKDYVILMCVFSSILIMLTYTSANSNSISLISFLAILGFNIYSIAKDKRQGFKITSSGFVLTDIIVACICAIIFTFVSKWGLMRSISISVVWALKCMLIQIIVSIIFNSYDKRIFKKLKSMEKQRTKYERKLDKIYGKRKR